MAPAFEILTAILLLIGGAFVLVGSIGLARLPDIFTRLHGPTKATTLGLGAIIVAVMLHETVREGRAELAEIAISLFLFMTAPVVAHLLSKAAIKTVGRPRDQG